VAAQHTANKAVARVCSRCLRYVGSVEAQLALRLLPGGDAAGAPRARRRRCRRRGAARAPVAACVLPQGSRAGVARRAAGAAEEQPRRAAALLPPLGDTVRAARAVGLLRGGIVLHHGAAC